MAMHVYCRETPIYTSYVKGVLVAVSTPAAFLRAHSLENVTTQCMRIRVQKLRL